MLLFLLASLAENLVQDAATSPGQATLPQIEAAADDASSRSAESAIVVRGERGDVGPGNRPPRVILGSRIPQVSLQTNPYLASATSLGGLTPGSGMDAFENRTVVTWKSCKVPGFSISSDVGCALRKARKAIDARQWQDARESLIGLTSRPDLSLEGQYLAHRMSYEVAAAIGDREARRRSLAAMVDTGLMAAPEEPAALRTLASMAMKTGDTADAIARYRDVIVLDPDDHQSRINLAVLLRNNQDEEGARMQFLGAIAIMQRSGLPIPESLMQASR